ncbi:hypothetical protein JW948_14690 [bacterium]|nr:hypothetical protein [bacterium]
MNFKPLILSIVMTAELFAQIHPKTQVAVLNFDALGISAEGAKLLTDRFRGELVNTGGFVVLEREIMSSILDEVGFQMTGCTSTECAIEAGRILQVEKIISGSIGKIGDTYTTNISLIDVESSQIERFFNRDYVGKVDGLLHELKSIAFEIAGKQMPRSVPPKNAARNKNTIKKPVSAPTKVKDPNTAMFLSLIFPGGGHFYCERNSTGILYLITESAIVALGANIASSGAQSDLYTFLAVAGGIHIIDIFHAGHSARNYNKNFSAGLGYFHYPNPAPVLRLSYHF